MRISILIFSPNSITFLKIMLNWLSASSRRLFNVPFITMASDNALDCLDCKATLSYNDKQGKANPVARAVWSPCNVKIVKTSLISE